jgi:hypothetical protein
METKKDIKVSVFLDKEMATFIDENKTYGMRRSDYMRGLVWEKMKRKSRKKIVSVPMDEYGFSTITPDLIPNDLKDCADLIEEWWPIRKQKGAINSTKVAERIFKKLRTFTPKDRKIALEKAIAGGWRDIYEIKQSKIAEEPKNNHPASRVFTAKGGFQ